ncbi:MAG: fibronectin type III domain-containing protein, partial [Acidimicrobiales bacterium]
MSIFRSRTARGVGVSDAARSTTRSTRSRAGRIAGALGAACALTLGSASVIIGGAGSAVAVANNPPGNPTAPAISYEADCTSTLEAGKVAPYVTTLLGNTSVDSAAPTGATFGFSGTAGTTIVGAFVANIYALGLGTNPLKLQWTEAIGSTDGNATGSYTYNSPTLSQPDGGGTVAKVAWSSGSTTLTGDFAGAAVGDAVASSTAGLAANATITAITGKTSATITPATTAAGSKATVGYGANTTFLDSTLATGNVFTTAGTSGQTAGIGITSATQFTITAAIAVKFGGATGDGPANCLLTGYDGSGNPGPGQTGGVTPPLYTVPVLPDVPPSTTPLISVSPTLQFQPAAYVNLQGAQTVPGAPTGATATAGNASASVSWTPPADDGGSAITSYTATSSPGGLTCSAAASPCTVSGLTNGTAYTFTVVATNSKGNSVPSAPSNSVTPATTPGAPTGVTAVAHDA